ncbi:hypothetical protein BGX31_010654 [Mortierella sp. GBA43]|nr:hypothetical protein BGX31_010654 [Mortierella sp. GBA43]
MKPVTSILSLSVASLLLTLSPSTIPGATCQHISQILNNAKIVSEGSTTIGGYKHHPRYKDPIIHSSNLVENVIENAYWIDFHEQFDQHAKFSDLVRDHPGITLRHEFWDPLNAVSISVRDEGVLMEILDQIPGIKLVEPVIMHERPDFLEEPVEIAKKTGSKVKSSAVHSMTGVDEVHESLKLFGNGIKVGIIDSGVDYHHPALGGCFGSGCKVAYGTDFVGDDGMSPDDDPMTDCDGHGTHVAGIIAANDTDFIGVAPQATLGAYRVFGCKGGTSNDIIMKALLRAAADGMQIINLSLGGPGGWRQEREARLADSLARNGTIVVAAMGNEGNMGLFEASSPGVAETVITVASTENVFKNNMWFTVDKVSLKLTEEPRPILYGGDFDMDLTNTTLVQTAPGTSGQVKSDACKPITKDLTGKIALIRRGDCTFKIKVANAALANAMGVIIMDNQPSDGLSADTEGSTIKVRTITLDDGEYLLKMIQQAHKEADGIKLVAGRGPKKIPNPSGGFMSLFSSMGPDTELNSKPDIAAPGGQIWSTFPIKLGSYASLSGTSMATPYVAGCVALYLEGLPNASHSADSIKTALQNTAQPRTQQTDHNGYASVTVQGAGLLNLLTALKTQTIASPSHISLNDTMHMNADQKITLTNNGKSSLQYTIDIIPAVGLLPFDKDMTIALVPKVITADASVKMSNEVVTVEPGTSTTVNLVFNGPDTDPTKYAIYSGFVRFTPKEISNESPVLHIPFMGMHGDYKKVNILDPSFGLRIFDARGHPLQANGNLGSDTIREPGHVGTGVSKSEVSRRMPPTGGEPDSVTAQPVTDSRQRKSPENMMIVFRMITGSEALVLDLVSDKGDDPYQVESFGVLRNGVARYVPRNDHLEGNAFQVIGWDGVVMKEDGSTWSAIGGAHGRNYRLRVSLLKHFGSLENDMDFEAHLSRPFTLP